MGESSRLSSDTIVSADEPLIGRARELAELEAGLREAVRGRGGLFLIHGEAGIGKTRLADEIVRGAQSAGAVDVWARSWHAAGAPPYWPWVHVFRGLLRGLPTDAIPRVIGASAAAILQLAPDLADILEPYRGDRPPPVRDDDPPSDAARFRLFDAVSSTLRRATDVRPAVIVFDDLHWADVPSLRLLEFCARDVADARLLLIGTYRQIEARGDAERAAALARLARLGRTLPLKGLDPEGIHAFVESRFGVSLPEQLVSAFVEATLGNPLYIDEVLSLFATKRGTDFDWMTIEVPEGVRETIRERLTLLPAGAEDVLRVASVIGPRFSLALLERVVSRPRAELLEMLGGAESLGLLQRASAGAYTFVHTVLRETLAAAIPQAERPALHLRIGEAMEQLWASDLEPHLSELAHQFVRGAAAGGGERAIAYSTSAADRASSRLAYEEAAWHLGCALEVLGVEAPDARRRSDLLVRLGDARARFGTGDAARSCYEDAARLAEELDDADLLARAALGIGTQWSEVGRTDDALVALLGRAAERLGARDSAVRARLLARLAMELHWTAGPAERLTLCRRSIEMARRVGDKRTLAFVLSATHFALAGLGDAEQREAEAREMLRLAEDVNDKELALEAYGWLVADLLELGDVPGADAGIQAYTRIAEQLRQASERWGASVFRAMRAQLDGRFDDAQRLALEALTLGQQAGSANAPQVFGVQMATILTELGRASDLIDPARSIVEQQPDVPGWRCALAGLYAEVGRHAEARDEFERMAHAGFGSLPQDLTWLPAVASLARVCAFLGDEERAAALYDLLLPRSGRIVVVGYHVACMGPVDHELGILAATTRCDGDAERHLGEAVRLAERMGARPFVARAELARAQVARTVDGPGSSRFVERASRALSVARDLGMAGIVDRASALLGAAPEQPGDRPAG